MLKKQKRSRSNLSLSVPERALQLARQLVVPHRHNQYRPHATRRYGIIVALTLVLGLQFMLPSSQNILGDEAEITVAALAKETNDVRMQKGLGSLKLNQKLNDAAYQKAQNMFVEQYWAHDSPSGKTPWQWFGKADYNYSDAGENLAKNYRSAEATTAAWLASPSHRANLLNKDYRDVGFAVVSGELDGQPTTLVVALYGTPTRQTDVVSATTAAPSIGQNSGLLTRLGVAIQSISPTMIGSLVILFFLSGIAFAAHLYRNQLPKRQRESWYRYHGALKAGGAMLVVVILLIATSGGQI